MYTMVLTDTGEFEPLIETEYRHWIHETIEGAVMMEVDGAEVWGTDLWDEVSDFWPYMINVAGDCRSSGQGESSFPDQPLQLGMRQVSPGLVEVRIWVYKGEELRRVVVPADELWSAMRDGFEEFVEHAIRLGFPEDYYSVYQARLREW